MVGHTGSGGVGKKKLGLNVVGCRSDLTGVLQEPWACVGGSYVANGGS